jgi:hypothetical protein
MNELTKTIFDIMNKPVGIMAEAIIENNCERIGTNADTLTQVELKELLPLIENGIRFFKDKEVAVNVINEIKLKFGI